MAAKNEFLREARFLFAGLAILALVLWLCGYRPEKASILGIGAVLALAGSQILAWAHSLDVELAQFLRGELSKARSGKGTIIFMSLVGGIVLALGLLTLVVAIFYVIAF